jgi:hypothetical protein
MSGASLEIAVAPLTLPGLSEACYDLRVTNADDGGGTTVWAKGNPAASGADDPDRLCSGRYGNGGSGAITFVGACDASAVTAGDGGRTNSVTLWVDSLVATGGTLIAKTGSDGWQDPCPSGCTLNATCQENTDTRLEFNLTILRQANQGFFDIGVNFEDIFCSAKVDCKSASGDPLNLLFNPATGQRGSTIVAAFACTAGAGAGGTTVLYRDPLKVTCTGSETEIFPDTGEGNAWASAAADPAPTDPIWQYAIYANDESLLCGGQPCNKRFWNVAFGLDTTADNCTLTTSMTASGAPLTDFATPAVTTYPFIAVNLPLTDTNGLICNRHALNAGSGLTTRYTSVSTVETFETSFDGTDFDRRGIPCSVACLNGGTCNLDGQCECAPGWTGQDCSTALTNRPPGDLLTTASLSTAYGLRRLRSAYAGPAVRVRRSSDGTEQDIGLTASGELDTSALMAFVGTQNLVRQSQTFGTSPWVVHQNVGTVTSNSTTAPDGTLTAETWATTAQPAYLYQTFSLTPGTYTLSLYAKALTTNRLRVDFVTSGFGKGTRVTFDLANGTITLVEHFGAFRGLPSIVSEANGWRRISISLTVLATETWYHEITHTSVGGVAVWGAQVNSGSSAQPYAVTTSTTQPGGDGFIATLYDQSPNAKHATSTSASTRPRLVQSGAIDVVRGRPAVRFDGTDDFLQVASTWPTNIGVAAFANRAVSGTDHYLIDNSNDVSIGGGLSLRFRNNDTARFWSGDGLTYSATTTATTGAATPRLLVANSSASLNTIHLDGALAVQVTQASTTRNEKPMTRIGHSELFGGFLNGHISELLVFSQALGATDLAAIHYSLGRFYEPLAALNFDARDYSGSGTLWRASEPRAYAGTLAGSPTFNASGSGSVTFDGDDDRIVTTFGENLTTTDLSMCAWVRPTFSSATFGRPIVAKSESCSMSELSLDFGRAPNRFNVVYRDDLIVASNEFPPNVWHHVCWTRSLSGSTYTNKLYVDGGLEATSNLTFGGTATATGSKLTIGHSAGCGSVGTWRGDMGTVTLYPSALSGLDVSNLFAATRSRFGL